MNKKDNWISVQDELPKDNQLVLIYNWSLAYRQDGLWYRRQGFEIHTITHWQPLPKPPSNSIKEVK